MYEENAFQRLCEEYYIFLKKRAKITHPQAYIIIGFYDPRAENLTPRE